jgi:hypothetical protein
MVQAAGLDGLLFDAPPFSQNGFAVHRLMLSSIVTLIATFSFVA